MEMRLGSTSATRGKWADVSRFERALSKGCFTVLSHRAARTRCSEPLPRAARTTVAIAAAYIDSTQTAGQTVRVLVSSIARGICGFDANDSGGACERCEPSKTLMCFEWTRIANTAGARGL